jgi:solute:Na+ symporter, SSS family
MFTLWDWMVIGLYFAAMAWIGWFFSRRNRNFSDFIFGGSQMPWLAIGISLIATSVSATTFLGNPADTFGRDMSLLMLNFGSIFAIILIGWICIPRFKNSGIRSAYELLERRFSRPVRVLAASLYCMHLVLRSGILIYGPALVLEKRTGAPPCLFPSA